MLSAKFIAARLQDLLKERDRLEREIKSLGKFEEYGTSEDDSAQEAVAYEKNISQLADLQASLSEVKQALEKIERGTYGKCERGPEEIEEGRLKASPAAPYCIKHQQEIESRTAIRHWWKPWTWKR